MNTDMSIHRFGEHDSEKCVHKKATVSFRLPKEGGGTYLHTEEFVGNEDLPLMSGGTFEVCPAMRADTFAAQVAIAGWTDRTNEELGEIRHWMMHEIIELKVHTFGSETAS